MKKDYLSNFFAAFVINAAFWFNNLLGMIPEWILPGDPATDAIWERKIELINIVTSFKAWVPYLMIIFLWRIKMKVDIMDYMYAGLFLFTCLVSTFDAFINPYRDTTPDWVVLWVFWLCITALKLVNYRKLF